MFENQENNVNKLVVMEIKYIIFFAKCSKNNISLIVLIHRLKLLYQIYKQVSILEEKYETFKQNGKISQSISIRQLNLYIYLKT